MSDATTPRSKRPVEARTRRLGRLALLPLFADLDGRPALVAGDSPAAAWKAELLAAAGAHVLVASADPSAELAALLSNGAAAGRLTRLPQAWRPDDLNGMSIAIADAVDEDEARRFADAARAAGTPYNVIDRPTYGSVQFGSIVNRSPGPAPTRVTRPPRSPPTASRSVNAASSRAVGSPWSAPAPATPDC